jgi:hypothetical protein
MKGSSLMLLGVFRLYLINVMSEVFSSLASKLIKGSEGIDNDGLYINVDFVDEDLIFVDYRYKNKKGSRTGFYSSAEKGEQGMRVLGELEAQAASTNEGAKTNCLGAYIVRNVSARPQGGWGRLLYYVAMHFASTKGVGITADRVKSSANAVSAWNNLYSDPSVRKELLDNYLEPTTQPIEDDCNLASSGIYGAEKSKDSYEWNPKLQHGDSEESETEEKKTGKGEEYRKIKASKLNYVYKGSFPDIISQLIQTGKLHVGGQQLNESIKLFDLLF